MGEEGRRNVVLCEDGLKGLQRVVFLKGCMCDLINRRNVVLKKLKLTFIIL